MKIRIETPKFSFFKYQKVDDEYKRVLFSPIPTIFNYGFIEDTLGDDGMEEDAIVLGPRLPQGTLVKLTNPGGVVRFVDDSVRDDKKVFYLGDRYSERLFGLYFSMYALFKRFRYLAFERRLAECRFEGIELFEEN
ncbi:inorganic diphosphatase [Methanococcoides sp. AM1]|uniref:inorganic diphosphatase n=1 Tax=Methanococcoides sp. AM1 TaxID=1201011 RepID=UPI00108304C7|nr:inorganic diphosphatase [Methanococcoides sp. AM1]